MNSAIISAIITAIATLIVGLLGPIITKRIKRREFSRKWKTKWWIIITIIGVISISSILYIFWPKWYVLDSGSYHLGDNVFRMDQQERPKFQYPYGTNLDCLILWDKDTGEFYSSNSYTLYPDPGIWEDLHLEKYNEVYNGQYYLGKIVIGYTKTIDLRDLLKNNWRLAEPKILIIDFDVFDLQQMESEGGQLIFLLNNGEVNIPVKSLNRYERNKWSDIENIVVPLNILNSDINIISLFVTPKYSYHNDKRYYHFEDVEISNIRIKLN